jgi:hypothetical protein
MSAANLSALLETALSASEFLKENDPKRLTSLRFSGLPFCPVRFSVNSKKSSAKFTTTDFSFNYYTSVGTIVHTLVQTALEQNPLKGYVLLADWVCPACSKKYVLTAKPTLCSCGSSDLTFEEHEIHRKSLVGGSDLLGHVDTLLLDTKSNLITLVDWKTTSIKNIDSAIKAPSLEYKTQIRSYAAALGTQVTTLALGFIPRDNPFKHKFYTEDFDEHVKYSGLLDRWSIQHAQALAGDYVSIAASRPCRTRVPEVFKNCKLQSSCSGRPDSEIITFLRSNSAFSPK